MPVGWPEYCAACPNFRPDEFHICAVFSHWRKNGHGTVLHRFAPILGDDGLCRAYGVSVEPCKGCGRVLFPAEVAARPKSNAYCAQCAEGHGWVESEETR